MREGDTMSEQKTEVTADLSAEADIAGATADAAAAFGAAGAASAESLEILNLLGDQESGGACCGGGCCSV